MLPGQKTSPIRRKWSASSTTIAGIESFWPSVSTSTLRSIASPRRLSSATLLVLGQLDVQTALGCTGRTLVLEGRQSKQWTCQPLPPKISYGKRGMGPETISEARPESSCHSVANSINSVARRWRCKSLACRRGSACDLRSSQSSKEGVHSSKCCLERRRGLLPTNNIMYRVAGGDNAVEGTFGMISNCLRKTNSRGRNAKSKTRTLLAQSAAALVRRPGVNNIPLSLSAYKTYREALLKGPLGLSPQQAFKLEKLTWLIPTEEEERDTET